MEVKEMYPLTGNIMKIKEERDAEIQKIFTGKSDKLLLIIGPCSADNEDSVLDYMERLARVQEKVMRHDWALQLHGFYADIEAKTIRFDVVLSFDIDQKEAMDTLYAEIREIYPDYEIQIVPDVDISD